MSELTIELHQSKGVLGYTTSVAKDNSIFVVKKTHVYIAASALLGALLVAAVITFIVCYTGQTHHFSMEFPTGKKYIADLKKHIHVDEEYGSFAQGNKEHAIGDHCSEDPFEFELGFNAKELYTRYFKVHPRSRKLANHAFDHPAMKCDLYYYQGRFQCMDKNGFLLQTCFIDFDGYFICQEWYNHKKLEKKSDVFNLNHWCP
ncbi:hypothetical protein RCL1_003818 [Eukaryota sp. TZLM3-RCL]